MWIGDEGGRREGSRTYEWTLKLILIKICIIYNQPLTFRQQLIVLSEIRLLPSLSFHYEKILASLVTIVTDGTLGSLRLVALSRGEL